jgi:hypothetical protein
MLNSNLAESGGGARAHAAETPSRGIEIASAWRRR